MDPITVGAVAVSVVATRKVVRKKLAQKKMAWLESFMPVAQVVCQQYGVPPQVCVAQAALESGWGRASAGYNYFGIKGTGTAGAQKWNTKEFKDGQMVATEAKFARFKSMEDGIAGYCKLLTGHPWFKPASEKFPNDPAAFVTWLWGMGYASGPNYPATLVGIMRLIYRATGDESYNVSVSPKLGKVIAQLREKKMGSARRQLTQALLQNGPAALAGFVQAGNGRFVAMPPGGDLAGVAEGAEALEETVNPLWWILPTVAGVGLVWLITEKWQAKNA